MVIVSHSAKLATALVEIAQHMTPNSQTVPLAAAGGVDDPQNPFGIDVIKIQTAIESL